MDDLIETILIFAVLGYVAGLVVASFFMPAWIPALTFGLLA